MSTMSHFGLSIPFPNNPVDRSYLNQYVAPKNDVFVTVGAINSDIDDSIL